MKNCWVTSDEPMAAWVADLSSIRHNSDLLFAWLCDVINAGEQCEVYTVHEAPTIHFRRERDGPLSEYLERMFETTRSVDLFQFAETGMRLISGVAFCTFARMAYFNPHGDLVEDDVDDLGLLLQSLRPADIAAAGSLMSHCPPIEIRGPRIDFNNPERSIWALKKDQVRVRFRLFSDIWLPFVRGLLEEDFDPLKFYDNRVLAERHTPRLNRFFRLVRELTIMHGNSWELDEDETRRNVRFMVTISGIALDAAPPTLFAPPSKTC